MSRDMLILADQRIPELSQRDADAAGISGPWYFFSFRALW